MPHERSQPSLGARIKQDAPIPVSVVVVNRNGVPHPEDYLVSLVQQSYPAVASDIRSCWARRQ